MKTITTSGWGLSAELVLNTISAPTRLGANDVLVQVHGASVNPKDWKLNYHAAVAFTPLLVSKLPPFFGDDLAGVIIDKGSKVRDCEIGDAVYGMDMRPRTASLAERTRIDQKRIAKKPPSLTFQQAASMPLAAQTALQGLKKGKAEAGKTVLIIGASGGVGTFAVQIAKAMGLNVAGVDLLRSSRGPLVMEVNSSPGLEGIENATGKNVAGMIINWTEKNYKPWKTKTRGRG